MDIKSIVRVFRYGELQARAEKDPNAKRPPTIMFLGLAASIGLAVLGVSLILKDASPTDGAGGPLGVSDGPGLNNTTGAPPGPQEGPPREPAAPLVHAWERSLSSTPRQSA